MKRRSTSRHSWPDAVEISAAFVLLLACIEFLDQFLGLPLDHLGIHPRTTWGLLGILFSPLLHGNWMHLMANGPALFVLLVFLFWDRKYYPEKALAAIWLGSGLGTWLIGRGDAIHIGASSLIYGLVVYLVAAAWWLRSWRSALVAAIVFLLYGGIVYGMMPQRGIISWEGHLAGAIAGWWAAKRNFG